MKLGLYLSGLGTVLGFGPGSLTAAQLEVALDPCGVEKGGAEGQNISCPQALPFIQEALSKYELTTAEAIAFYISLLSIESGNLSYNKNVFPGRAGQGTRAMTMPNNLHAFLKASPEITKDNCELAAYASKPYDDSNNVAKNRTRDILMDNKYSFLPGAWWIKEGGVQMKAPNCKEFKEKLVAGITDSGVEELLSKCLGVPNDPARIAAYKKAYNAIAPKQSSKDK